MTWNKAVAVCSKEESWHICKNVDKKRRRRAGNTAVGRLWNWNVELHSKLPTGPPSSTVWRVSCPSVRVGTNLQENNFQRYKLNAVIFLQVGPGSAVGKATGYGLDGPGIESRWGGARSSAPVQTGPGAHPASYTMGTGSFPGVKSGWGVTLTPHPLLVPWSWKGRAIPLLLPMGRTACTEPQCLYKGALYL